MAYLSHEYCSKCNFVTPHCNHKCSICVDNEVKKEKNRWDELSIEEKVEEIKHRLDSLERSHNPIKYY